MYGPYKYIERNSYEPINVEYITFAMIIIQHYDREIDASSIFGKIKITETFELINKGPELKLFSVDYHKPAINRIFNWFVPKNSTEIKFYDSLGYISFGENWPIADTDWISLSLRLRYPLFGAWKTSFILSYMVPSDDYLFLDKDTNNFTLKMPIIRLEDHRTLVLSFLTRIILPPNAKILAIKVFEKSIIANTFQYLKYDTIPSLIFMAPRKVVKFFAKNILKVDNSEFLIRYYSNIKLWYVGCNLVCGIEIMFLIGIALCHMFGGYF